MIRIEFVSLPLPSPTIVFTLALQHSLRHQQVTLTSCNGTLRSSAESKVGTRAASEGITRAVQGLPWTAQVRSLELNSDILCLSMKTSTRESRGEIKL